MNPASNTSLIYSTFCLEGDGSDKNDVEPFWGGFRLFSPFASPVFGDLAVIPTGRAGLGNLWILIFDWGRPGHPFLDFQAHRCF